MELYGIIHQHYNMNPCEKKVNKKENKKPFREVEFVIMQTFVYNVNEFYIKKPPQVLA